MKWVRFGFILLAITTNFSLAQQDTEWRVLYNRIENLPAEADAIRRQQGYPKPNAPDKELQQLATLIQPSVSRAFAKWKFIPCDEKSMQSLFSRPWAIQSGYKIPGSFASYGRSQILWIYTICAGKGIGYQAGLAIVDNGKLIANFLGNHFATSAYSVRDINQNGLSELLLVVPYSERRFGNVSRLILGFGELR